MHPTHSYLTSLPSHTDSRVARFPLSLCRVHVAPFTLMSVLFLIRVFPYILLSSLFSVSTDTPLAQYPPLPQGMNRGFDTSDMHPQSQAPVHADDRNSSNQLSRVSGACAVYACHVL